MNSSNYTTAKGIGEALFTVNSDSPKLVSIRINSSYSSCGRLERLTFWETEFIRINSLSEPIETNRKSECSALVWCS